MKKIILNENLEVLTKSQILDINGGLSSPVGWGITTELVEGYVSFVGGFLSGLISGFSGSTKMM